MATMTHEEWRAFVSAGTRTGKLAVVRAAGRAHVTPVWFVLGRSHDDQSGWGQSGGGHSGQIFVS